MIEVIDLSVRFGGVVPIDRMTITFPGGTCGLIGPNGAGKTTFFNVLSGFVRPIGGRVVAFGDDLLAIPDFKRPRWGLRRTFQTEQAIANLSVYQNVLLVHEHTGGEPVGPSRGRDAGGELRRSRSRRRIDSSAASAPASAASSRSPGRWSATLGSSCSTSRRPASPTRRQPISASSSGASPTETGGLVILVDHDMSLVSACCETTAVLDFGRLIASGETAKVLRDEQVIRAYLGTEEVA